MSTEQQPKNGAEAIEQRNAGYGGFDNVARTKRAILRALDEGLMINDLDDVELTALEEIAGKLSRIVNGSTKADNWIDISGYATLVTTYSPANVNQINPPKLGKGRR